MYPPVFVNNLWQTVSIALVSCNCLDNHACEHINTLECTELFRAYTDLENQGATNAG